MAMELFWVRWALTGLAALAAGVGFTLADDWMARSAMVLSVVAVHVVLVDAEARKGKKRLSP